MNSRDSIAKIEQKGTHAKDRIDRFHMYIERFLAMSKQKKRENLYL